MPQLAWAKATPWGVYFTLLDHFGPTFASDLGNLFEQYVGRQLRLLPRVREILLDIGRDAARQLGRLDEALDLNAAQIASMHDRRAPASDIARAMFNDYAPLLRLDRTNEALDLLVYCRRVFEDAHDTRMLGNTLSGLASAENKRGHREPAIRLQRDALRYKYLAEDATGIAVSYHNLGNYLSSQAIQRAQAFACHLAAALIRTLASISRAGNSVQDASTDLRELGDTAVLPLDVADLSRQVGDIPGTDLPGLIAKLSPSPEVAEATLRDLIAQAQVLATAPPPG
jgi:tetratricopeptide (TPR) repeat protein